MPDPVGSFLRRFEAFGGRPSVASYLALFHPEATLLDAGMPRPITVAEIPEHIEGILRVVPDFRMVPERFRARAGTVFVEARNEATLAGALARWRSVYCVDLQGDRVIRGRRYYDRRPLFARLDPTLPALLATVPVAGGAPPLADPWPGPEAVVRAFAAACTGSRPEALAALFREDGSFAGPELSRPLVRDELAGYQRRLSRLPELRGELLAFAGDAQLAFAEWQVTARLAGEPVALRAAGRFDLAGGLVLSARLYFDTLELALGLAARAPAAAPAEARP